MSKPECNTDPMPWGKHKGLQIKMLPTSYLQWLRDNCDWDDNMVDLVTTETIRRDDEDDHVWREHGE